MASSEVSEVFTSFEDGLRGDTGSAVDVVSVTDHNSLAQIEIDSGIHSGGLGHRLDIINQVRTIRSANDCGKSLFYAICLSHM